MRQPLPSAWRAGPALALVVLGFAIVASIDINRPGPRLSRKARLVDLIRAEDERARDLRRQLASLEAQMHRVERAVGRHERGLRQLRARLEGLAVGAAMTALRGPGVVVELRDSRLRDSPSGNPNDLVIHEQDLQAVVNAMWSGGAEGIAINDERITVVSAVRCVGNTLLLHGSVYSPPYRIEAIGDPRRLLAALEDDVLVQRFEIIAEEYRLGFDVERSERVDLPPYRGILATRYARPA